MNPLLSIIIPVKDNETTIADMLRSINKQTYDNIEVIIAYDDRTADNTLQAIEEVDLRYPLKIVRGIDTSIGSARNKGYAESSGQFVWFCDSDDELFPTSAYNLVQPLIENPEINVSAGKWYICESQNPNTISRKYRKYLNKSAKPLKYKVIDSVTAMHSMWSDRAFSVTAWAYVTRRSFLDSYAISFPDYSHGEDQIYVLKMMINTPNIILTKNPTYFYKVHDNSVSHIDNTANKFWNDHYLYRKDYFQLVGERYPGIEILSYADYLRWFVYQLAGESKEKFYANIEHYGIQFLPITLSFNIPHLCSSILFNTNRELYRKISRIYRKLRRE